MKKLLLPLSLAVSLTAPAAEPSAQKPKAKASTASPKKSAAKRETKVPIYDTYALGEKALLATQQACEQSNRRMFANFGTNDCELCRVVNDAIHEPIFYDVFIKQFVPVFVDVTPGGPNIQLLKDQQLIHELDITHLPAILIFDDKGRFMEATTKGELAAAAKKGKEEVQKWILARFYATQGSEG